MIGDPPDFVDLLVLAAWTLEDEEWGWFLDGLSPPVRRRIYEEFFHWQAHGGQAPPPDHDGEGRPWRVWFLRAGRGFGKTMAGAHWVLDRARENPGARIALVGGTRDDVRKVMIEGPGGLIANARALEPVEWNPTQGTVRFASGAQGFVYSARAAEKLRGPEHDFAWCDELAKWDAAARGSAQGERAWDNLQMGMRRGKRPLLVVTTTPRCIPLVHRVLALEGTAETRGRTVDNVHLAEDVLAWAMATYGGTRLGRQELDGELFDDAEGALWTREIIEACRVEPVEVDGESVCFPAGHGGAAGAADGQYILSPFKRVVVGVDPPVSVGGDACGIVVCALGEDDILWVLDDRSEAGLRPDGWARKVAAAAEFWGADRVVAEKNQGGDMVEEVLRGASVRLPVRLVSASRGKAARAEPVAAEFERGKARIAGRFPQLEDELAGLTHGGGYQGPGRSPDRADAMVWAMTELIKPIRRPRVRAL